MSIIFNKIRIPGDEGTQFNANETLDFRGRIYVRLRGGVRIKNRHNVFLLYAPLQLNYEGSFNNEINFNGSTFSPDEYSQLLYQFNSYRLTYRYDFFNGPEVRFGAGLSLKIRDAFIQIDQGEVSSRKSNVGFVPLINLYVHWKFSERVGLLLEGDGLASSQGRAFDFQLSVPVYITDKIYTRLGYRMLEGGADNEEVYNFTMVHYLALAAAYNF